MLLRLLRQVLLGLARAWQYFHFSVALSCGSVCCSICEKVLYIQRYPSKKTIIDIELKIQTENHFPL